MYNSVSQVERWLYFVASANDEDVEKIKKELIRRWSVDID